MLYWWRSSLAMFSKDWFRSLALNGKNACPPVSAGEVAQHLVAVGFDARDIGGDGVDGDVGLLRHFERLVARVAALVIFAIAEDHHGAAEFVERLILHQLVAAGEEDGVVEGGSAAGPQIPESLFQAPVVVGQVGDQFGGGIEADDQGFILARAHHAVDECDGGFLLEAETLANAVAGVDQDRQAQRQIGFSGEFDDRLAASCFRKCRNRLA